MNHRRTPSRSTLRTARLAFLALVSLTLAACASSSPTTSPDASPLASAVTSAGPTAAPTASATPAASVDPAAVYDAIERQVEAIRGLTPSKPVERQIIDEEELRTILTKMYDEGTPPAYLAGQERLYKALGLMPQDGSVRDLTLDLLSGSVAGFYRDDQGKLSIVSSTGRIGGVEKIIFAHEYGHALQDQAWPVFKDQRGVIDEGDRLMARAAVFEGDATLLMAQWMLGNSTPQDLQDVIKAAMDPAQADPLARVRAIMKETLLFPYQTGLAFVQAVQAKGGWAAVDKLYERMPESTEQIIHPEKYTAGETPVKVDMPADLATRLGAGWSVPMQDTFGEMQTAVWLREGGVETAAANDAAAGWGGDRLAVIEGPDDAWALAWQTVWDTPTDAAAFEAAATTALAKAGGTAQVLPGVGGTTRWVLVASDAPTMNRVANALDLAG